MVDEDFGEDLIPRHSLLKQELPRNVSLAHQSIGELATSCLRNGLQDRRGPVLRGNVHVLPNECQFPAGIPDLHVE